MQQVVLEKQNEKNCADGKRIRTWGDRESNIFLLYGRQFHSSFCCHCNMLKGTTLRRATENVALLWIAIK